MEKIFSYYYEWWKNIDKFIFFIIFLLFLLGLFFSLVSTSIIASDKLNTNTYYFFIKHLFFIFLGICLLISFSFIDQKKLLNSSDKKTKVFSRKNKLSPRLSDDIIENHKASQQCASPVSLSSSFLFGFSFWEPELLKVLLLPACLRIFCKIAEFSEKTSLQYCNLNITNTAENEPSKVWQPASP